MNDLLNKYQISASQWTREGRALLILERLWWGLREDVTKPEWASNGPKGAEAVDYNIRQILRADATDRQA